MMYTLIKTRSVLKHNSVKWSKWLILCLRLSGYNTAADLLVTDTKVLDNKSEIRKSL